MRQLQQIPPTLAGRVHYGVVAIACDCGTVFAWHPDQGRIARCSCGRSGDPILATIAVPPNPLPALRPASPKVPAMTTVGSLKGFGSGWLRDMHADMLKRKDASQERIVKARDRFHGAMDGVDAVGDAYEAAAAEAEKFVKEATGNEPLPSTGGHVTSNGATG
jgi:hypothetical protein